MLNEVIVGFPCIFADVLPCRASQNVTENPPIIFPNQTQSSTTFSRFTAVATRDFVLKCVVASESRSAEHEQTSLMRG